ncbi:hypothetical protein F5148DRAFT_35429 [Russula earlei]|uniref:Uncharacterized protein n=1 Tax=Russula earlei TaxID=71964 RepID=A0ACC0U8E6_9AGAM|nr:hypothetical protein F5148DRAFT_35429 [Russula earlei]
METMVMTIPSPIHSHRAGPGMSELQVDFELAALLDSLTLQQQRIKTLANEPQAAPTATTVSDVQMNDAGTYQSGTTASSNSSDAPRSATATVAAAPCALLESLTRSYGLDADGLQTTCGEYLELIFIHRELFAARPSAHAGCSAAFSAVARALELRAWRADRDADTEAVAAFRHEAWMVAAYMSSGGPWWRGGEKMAD